MSANNVTAVLRIDIYADGVLVGTSENPQLWERVLQRIISDDAMAEWKAKHEALASPPAPEGEEK